MVLWIIALLMLLVVSFSAFILLVVLFIDWLNRRPWIADDPHDEPTQIHNRRAAFKVYPGSKDTAK